MAKNLLFNCESVKVGMHDNKSPTIIMPRYVRPV